METTTKFSQCRRVSKIGRPFGEVCIDCFKNFFDLFNKNLSNLVILTKVIGRDKNVLRNGNNR